jgi:hypothetical protein
MKSAYPATAGILIALVFLTLPLGAASRSQEREQDSSDRKIQNYTVLPATSEIKVDGILDDHVSIMIDSFNDERRGFQFRVNPLGVQADANFSELEGYEDFSWDAIWESAGSITEWGWAFEIAIPFNQLRFPSGDAVQTWGFSAERSYPRSVRHRMISHPRDRNPALSAAEAAPASLQAAAATGRTEKKK